MKTEFNAESFFDKIQSAAKSVKRSVLYPAFLLHAVLRKKATPFMDKAVIVGAIAYLILPTDVVPDFILILGYTDDIAALLSAVSKVSSNVTPEIEKEAKDDYEEYFGERPDTTA